MEVVFSHGGLSPSYEEQANKQGYTLGNKAEKAEELRHDILVLMLNNVLTVSQTWNAYKRLQKKFIVPNLMIKEQDND